MQVRIYSPGGGIVASPSALWICSQARSGINGSPAQKSAPQRMIKRMNPDLYIDYYELGSVEVLSYPITQSE